VPRDWTHIVEAALKTPLEFNAKHFDRDWSWGRNCPNCHAKITLGEALRSSINAGVPREYIEAVWNDPLFEFLCCACYRHETKMPVHGLVSAHPGIREITRPG